MPRYMVRFKKDDPGAQGRLGQSISSEKFTILKHFHKHDSDFICMECDREEIENLAKDSNVEFEEDIRVVKAGFKPTLWRRFYSFAKMILQKAVRPKEHTEKITYVANPEVVLKKLAIVPDTTNFQILKQLWNIKSSRCVDVWAQGYNGEGVKVAILDTGTLLHKDTHQNVISGEGLNTVGESTPTKAWQDGDGHGNHVTGTIAAGNYSNTMTAIYGYAPKAMVVPIKVLDDDGSGWVSDIIEGLEYATKIGCRVVNLSLGSPESSNFFHDAIKKAVNAGVIVVAAAGNESGPVGYPGAYPEVITVGSYNESNAVSDFSDFGREMTEHGLIAPGERILSCSGEREYAYMSGTSMATPAVAGACAVLLQLDPDRINPTMVRDALREGAIELHGIDSKRQGAGKLDLPNAVVAINRIYNEKYPSVEPQPAPQPDPAPQPVPQPDLEPITIPEVRFAKGCQGYLIKEFREDFAKNVGGLPVNEVFDDELEAAIINYTDGIGEGAKSWIDTDLWREVCGREFPNIYECAMQLVNHLEQGIGNDSILWDDMELLIDQAESLMKMFDLTTDASFVFCFDNIVFGLSDPYWTTSRSRLEKMIDKVLSRAMSRNPNMTEVEIRKVILDTIVAKTRNLHFKNYIYSRKIGFIDTTSSNDVLNETYCFIDWGIGL